MLLRLAFLVIALAPAWKSPAQVISINFHHGGGVIAEGEKSGIVPVDGWNNLLVPGGFGLQSFASPFGPIAVSDLSGQTAANVSSTLQSYYNGDSGGSATGLGAGMMSEYISWDAAGDGMVPDDVGTITVAGLGPSYTAGGYDVILYFDTDANDRVHSISIEGQLIQGKDASTFNGILVEAGGPTVDSNYAVFTGLTGSNFSISMDSSVGRGALNALQIVASGYVLPTIDAPNILLFVVDDLGWQDLSVPMTDAPTVWNGLYDTPQLESLAASGMKFTNAYSAAPVCSPSRTSIMTGRNPARTGITNWLSTLGRSDGNSIVTDPIWNSAGLQPGDGNTTLPSILRDHGYLTAHLGKAHFGAKTTAGADPTSLGFDLNLGGSDWGNPLSYFPDYGGSAVAPGLEAYWGLGTYLNLALSLEATKVIDQAVASGTPFFMNMAHYAVHTPLGGHGDPAFLPTYASRPDPEDDYAAMIASVDASAAMLISHLESRGIADETLVIFVSDNGGLSRFARYDSPNPADPWHVNEHNAPLASGKGSALEGGIRVPMIVAWAGQEAAQAPLHPELPIAPGSTSDEPVHTDDFFATLLDVAGVPDTGPFLLETDGANLVPLLAGQPFQRDGYLYFHFPHQWVGDVGLGPGLEPFTAMRAGDWKLIYYWSGRNWSLYDLEQDLGEEIDLAQTHPAIVRLLGQQMIDWLIQIGAQLPRDANTLLDEPLPVLPATACDDGIDNDGDGQIDLADSDCAGDPGGASEETPTAVEPGLHPEGALAAILHPPHPNPANPRVEIRFELDRRSRARIDIYDLQGRHVDLLLDEEFDVGTHGVVWQGRDALGNEVSSGVYFVRLAVEGSNFTRRLTLIR